MQEPSIPTKGADSIAFQHIQHGDLTNFRKIGVGGFGTVYRAKHQTLGDVAVKKCRANSQSEVDSLAKPGPNNFIVQLFGWIQPTETDHNSYIVMEYMQYGSLKKFARKLNPFPDSLKIKMISKVIRGMHFLHNKKIVHRDLKLDNIFVGEAFSVKIGDLGFATWKSVEDPTKPTPGTVTHMAPEILNDVNKPATEESDVYSFGITLWELATCQDPYENAQNEVLIKMSVLEGQRPDMNCVQKVVPHIIKDMMERAWHQAPGKRPTFQVLKEEIEKEYADSYKNDYKSDLFKVYGQPFLEEEPSETCFPPWSRDNPNFFSRLPEDNISMHDGATPGPLCSSVHPRNGSILENRSVTVLDAWKGELPGVSLAMANLGLDGKCVQPVSDTIEEGRNPSESGLTPWPVTEEIIPMRQRDVQAEPDATQESWFHPQSVLTPGPTTEEFKSRIPTQESQHTNPEAAEHSSFRNQPQNKQETRYYPRQDHPSVPQDPQSQVTNSVSGLNLNISGDGHTVILAVGGGTVTMPEPKKEEKGEKRTGRQDYSSASKGDSHTASFERSAATRHRQKGKKLGRRRDSPSSSDSETDVLDPEVQEIMKSCQTLKEKHINTLSSHIGRKWRELGRMLGLSAVKVDNIEYDHYLAGQQEMAFQVMLAWMRKNGRATKGELAEALVDVGLSKVTLKLK